MTIQEALERLDSLKYNTYTDAEKIAWLDRLDRTVKAQVIDTHEGAAILGFDGYMADTAIETTLLIPAPYDEAYIHYLAAQIDFANGEFDKYNAEITMYNTLYTAYAAAYNREHMPVTAVRRMLF